MTLTITLPERLTDLLEDRAQWLQVPADQLVVQMVSEALNHPSTAHPNYSGVKDFSSLQEIVTKIKAQPKNLQSFHPATKTIDEVLAELAQLPAEEPEYSPAEWDQLWANFERQLDEVNLADDIAEGRS